jgi:hypothetical protein
MMGRTNMPISLPIKPRVTAVARTCGLLLSALIACFALPTLPVVANATPVRELASPGNGTLGEAPRLDVPQDTTGWIRLPKPKSASTRAAVAQLYNNIYLAGNGAVANWNGAIANCISGTSDANFRQAVIDRINFYRTLVDLPPVTLLGGLPTTQAQAAALIMSANGALSHSPPASWLCYTSDGGTGAGSSNLALGLYGVGAIDLYIDDPGSNNSFVGHRRWLLYPPRAAMATGDIPGSGGRQANAIYVFGPTTTRPATPSGIAWPPAGFVPYQVLPSSSNRWSLSYPSASFATAQVSLTGPQGAIPVTLQSEASGYGDNTIVFVPLGMNYGRPVSDTTYTVRVTGIAGTGVPPSIQYDVTVIDPAASVDLLLSPGALFLGDVHLGQSASQTVTLSNPSGATAALPTPTILGDFSLDVGMTTCGAVLAGGASCVFGIAFTPAASGVRNGSITLDYSASAPPISTSLSGNGLVGDYASNLNQVITGYYQTILARAPDAGGMTYWQGEVSRMSGLGANISDVFYVMAMYFLNSPEYLARNTDDTQFVTDLYRTFFARDPDAGGLTYWVGQLASGKPRGAVLNDFLFSAEFRNYMIGLFGSAAGSRAEVAMVLDYYRGLLARIPDTAGFNYWVGLFRTAQCQGAGPVAMQADTISQQFVNSAEYVSKQQALATSQRIPGYVTDLYNGFLKRGGDLAGFQFWVNAITTQAQTQNQVRIAFRDSPEFQGRVAGVVAQGCRP